MNAAQKAKMERQAEIYAKAMFNPKLLKKGIPMSAIRTYFKDGYMLAMKEKEKK